jgi:enoyl-[acyl-carrier protein] reductase I
LPNLLKGKKGLILGVANERSIAWGIAKVLADEGADLAFTYQTEGFEKRVRPLAESVGSKIIAPVDVQNEESMTNLYNQLLLNWGKIDFFVHAIAFSDKEELTGRFINSSKKNFLNSLDISCYSLINLSRIFTPLMTDGGTILTLTYIGSQRVTPNYNVMGVAKAALEATVKYLSNDLGLQKIRVNSISPGPMKTLAGAAIGGARKVFRSAEANSPLRSNASLDAVGGAALYLVSDYGCFTTGENIFVDGGYHVMGMPQIENI